LEDSEGCFVDSSGQYIGLDHIIHYVSISYGNFQFNLATTDDNSFVIGIAVPTTSVASSLIRLAKLGADLSLKAMWKQGFKVLPATISRDLGPIHATGTGTTATLLGHVLIANSPQLLLSFLYLFYNNIVTRQAVAGELLGFLHKDGKKPLRVSSPIGMQRSTYFLSLPWRYSMPLLGFSTTIHWLISQSIFLVQSSAFEPGPGDKRLPIYDFSARGYSPLGSVLVLPLASLIILLLPIYSSLRKYPDLLPDLKRMGCNSSAIRVLCQRHAADCDAHLFPVSLGIVQTEQSIREGYSGTFMFSTDINTNQSPEPGKSYLLPIVPEINMGTLGRMRELIKKSRVAFYDRFRNRGFLFATMAEPRISSCQILNDIHIRYTMLNKFLGRSLI
jgi:hypothetical protein